MTSNQKVKYFLCKFNTTIKTNKISNHIFEYLEVGISQVTLKTKRSSLPDQQGRIFVITIFPSEKIKTHWTCYL